MKTESPQSGVRSALPDVRHFLAGNSQRSLCGTDESAPWVTALLAGDLLLF
jgi:hypothetical protein